MNVGALTISLVARTAALMSSLAKVRVFENGVMASVTRINRSVGTLGQSLSVLSLPLVALGGLAVKTFADFEYTMAKVVGLSGVSAKQIQAWTGDVMKLSQRTGQSAQDLAEALYFVSSSGIHGSKVLETLEVSAYGAMAGLGKTKDIANLLTSVMNAYGVSNVDVAGSMDILVAAVREGKAEAEDMAKSLGMVVNVAAELGISFANVASAVAATTRTGVPVATSVTQLRQLLFSFIKERPMVDKALTTMGLSFEQVRKSLSDDLLTGLIKLRAVTSAWGDNMTAQVIPNVRAFNESISLTGANLFETMKLFKAIKTPTDAFATAVRSVADTAKVKLAQAMETVNNSLIMFGASIVDDVIPIVEKFTGFIEKLVGWFTSLDSGTQSMIITITALSAVFGPALLVVSSFVTALSSMVSGLFTPLGLILALVAAIVLVVRNLDYWEKAWPRIVQQMRKGGMHILKIMNAVTKAITFGLVDERLEKERNAIQYTIDEINAELNGFEPSEFIKRYQRLLRELGGVHPKQRNSLVSMIKQATASSLTLKEYNPETTKANPDLAYGATDALGDSLKKELDGVLGLVDGFTKDLNSKLSTAPKLSLGDGQINSNFLEYAAKYGVNAEEFEVYVTQIQTLVNKYGGLMAAFGEIPGFTETTSQTEFAQLLNENLARIQKDIANFMGNNQVSELENLLKSLPQGIKELMDLSIPNEWLAIFKKAREEADAFVMDMKRMQSLIDFSVAQDSAMANLLTKNKSNVGLPGPNKTLADQSAQLEYWQSIKQAAEETIKTIETNNTINKLTIPDLIPQEVLDRLKEANAQITLLTAQERMNSYIGVINELAGAFQSVGEAIQSAMADGKVTFSEAMGIISKGIMSMISLYLALASAGMIAAESNKGVVGLITAAAGLAAILGLFATFVKPNAKAANMASGGIVPSGYPNDSFNANLSSNEAVIPLERLPQLLGIGRSSGSQKVEFVIEGRVLKGILQDANMMGGLK